MNTIVKVAYILLAHTASAYSESTQVAECQAMSAFYKGNECS